MFWTPISWQIRRNVYTPKYLLKSQTVTKEISSCPRINSMEARIILRQQCLHPEAPILRVE